MFRTEIPLTPDPKQLARTARVLTLGSCFADSIGGRLLTHKVPALVNPFGTVFNPLSATLLLRAVAGLPVDWSQHLVEARGRWQSYDLHGSIGADSAEALLAQIQELVQRTAEFVRTADVLSLTLGTAWVYRLRETGELVSNCHKMPATLFEKELLAPEDIVSSVAEAHALLRRINPRLRLLLTLSPVRHLRDTLPLNSVSKGVLRLAAHYLSDLLPEVSYFPAYELLTDDLRDYRFYAADMLHPSAVAEEYIWERFVRTYFDADFGRFRKEWDGIQQALAHRPLHPGAPEHRQFLENTLDKLRRLAEQQVEVRTEIRDVERRLLALPPPPRPKPAPAPEPEDDEERIDIGQPEAEDATDEAEAPAATKAVAPTQAPAQPPQQADGLRTGRNRGRGRPQRQGANLQPSQALAETRPSENEHAPAEAVVPLPPKPSYTDFLISSAPELVRTVPSPAPEPEASVSAEAEAATEPELPVSEADMPGTDLLKKKKRRSRGGAKRTARKNAARLAAEQAALGMTATEATESPVVAESEQEIDASEQPAILFEDNANSEVEADPEAGFAENQASATIDSPSPDADADGAEPEGESAAAEVELTPKAAPKKRGTGSVAKKSKVIAKSAPVKRGGRQAAVAAPQAVVVPSSAEPAEAPTSPEAEIAPATPSQAKPARAPKAKSATAAKPAKKAPATTGRRAKNADVSPPPETASAPASPAVAPAPEVGHEPREPVARRGRPPGTKKKRANDPAAS